MRRPFLKCGAFAAVFTLLLAFGVMNGTAPVVAAQTPSAPMGSGTTLSNSGTRHSCALLEDRTVKCWGFSDSGALGNGTTDRYGPAMVPVVELANVIAISAGGGHSCALLGDGTVKCWGEGSLGQLGNGTTNDEALPVSVSGLTNVTAISAGDGHSCALLGDGTAKCWGFNSDGQLGNGTIENQALPVSVSGLTKITEIAAGTQHSCALLDDGTVNCWGSYWLGQIGDGTPENVWKPKPMAGLANVVSISAGGTHSCALLDDGTVKCLGLNWLGQLGDGTTDTDFTPVSVSGLTNVAAISSGYRHSCALLNDHKVKCWGSNSRGQLGDGTTDTGFTPVSVSGLTNVAAISSGFHRSCALLNDHTVKCWGINDFGQLGDGTVEDRRTPVSVGELTGVVHPGHFAIDPDPDPDPDPVCKSAYFVGVPGSGEQNVTTDNWDTRSRSMWNLRNGINDGLDSRGIETSTVGTVLIDYPAKPVESMMPEFDLRLGMPFGEFTDQLGENFHKYMDGKNDGVFELNRQISRIVNQCGYVPIMLGGYSQGAMVVHEWLNGDIIGSSKETGANIVSAGLIADPERVANSRVPNAGSAARGGQGVCSMLPRMLECNGTSTVSDINAQAVRVPNQVCDSEDIICDSSESDRRLWENYSYITKPINVVHFLPLGFEQIAYFGVLGASASTIKDALSAQAGTMVLTHILYGAHKGVKNVGFDMGMGLPL